MEPFALFRVSVVVNAHLHVVLQELRFAPYIVFDTSIGLVRPEMDLECVPLRILLASILYGPPVGSVSSPIHCSQSGSRSRLSFGGDVEDSVALSVVLSPALTVAPSTAPSTRFSLATSATSSVVLAVALSVQLVVASSFFRGVYL